MTSIEQWKPIKGFEKLYSISSRGRVWAHDRIVRRVHTGPYLQRGRLIAPRRGNQYGHLCVTLYRNEIKEKRYIHHLVAEAFLPREEGKAWVLHGARGLACNHVENLRWGSQSENELDKKIIPGKPGRDTPVDARSLGGTDPPDHHEM